MAIDTETIWEALADRLKAGADGFSLVTRQRMTQIGIEQMPTLMILDDSGDEVPMTERDDPEPVWRLTGEIVIVTRPPGDVKATPINSLISNVRGALERQGTDPVGAVGWGPGYVQHYTNLGGLIRVLSLVKVEKGAGEMSSTSVARLSIEMDAR